MKYFLICLLALASCQAPTPRVSPVPRYVAELRADAQKHPGSSTTLGCYVDLSLPDTGNRFFLLNLRSGQVILSAPCLNGLTDENNRVQYSNTPNSNCSSRGLVRIGEKYRGSFGAAYRLYGLEKTTSNVRKRAVVLHAWYGVPAAPVAAHPIQSQGCPTLNPQVLDAVSEYLDEDHDSVLLRFN